MCLEQFHRKITPNHACLLCQKSTLPDLENIGELQFYFFSHCGRHREIFSIQIWKRKNIQKSRSVSFLLKCRVINGFESCIYFNFQPVVCGRANALRRLSLVFLRSGLGSFFRAMNPFVFYDSGVRCIKDNALFYKVMQHKEEDS